MKYNKVYETQISVEMFEYFELFEGMEKKHIKSIKEEGCGEVSVTLHDGKDYVGGYYGGVTFEIEFPDTIYKVKTEPFHSNSPMGITFGINIAEEIAEKDDEED